MMREDALRFLYRELKSAKIALGRAETRPGVTAEELENLERKIAVIDWILPLVIKEDDIDHRPHNPEECRYYTIRTYDRQGGCLGTKEIDWCKGENCENWKPKGGFR